MDRGGVAMGGIKSKAECLLAAIHARIAAAKEALQLLHHSKRDTLFKSARLELRNPSQSHFGYTSWGNPPEGA